MDRQFPASEILSMDSVVIPVPESEYQIQYSSELVAMAYIGIENIELVSQWHTEFQEANPDQIILIYAHRRQHMADGPGVKIWFQRIPRPRPSWHA